MIIRWVCLIAGVVIIGCTISQWVDVAAILIVLAIAG